MSATSIVTASGDRFDPCFPDWKKVRIEDIAHALSRQTRFSGHVRGTWTVANHSLLVGQLVPQAHALAALLHDAAEAYLIDIPSPVKASGLISGYCGIETDIHAAVEKAFGVDLRTTVIKNWDKAALWAEAEIFMHGWSDWDFQPENADFLRIEIARNAILGGTGQPLVNRIAGRAGFYNADATKRLFLREFSRLNSLEFDRCHSAA